MTAVDELKAKLANYERERLANRRWLRSYLTAMMPWTLLMVTLAIFSGESYVNALIVVYFGGSGMLVAWTIFRSHSDT